MLEKEEMKGKSESSQATSGGSPPWGEWKVIERGDGYKVKRIDVLPGNRLSYQKHSKRDEHWVVVRGKAKVTLEGKEHILDPGDAVDIPREALHRIENIGKDLLSFIEVSMGSYIEEEDVIRVEDDYGRAG
jgi:mannose-6-phosphate isomerase